VSAPVAGLVLAAGGGRRLGGPKALVEVGGLSLAERGVRTLLDGGCATVHMVTGAAPVAIPGAVGVDNPHWAEGMGSSVRAGLAALPDTAGAAVVMPVDQPLITPEAVARLIAAFRAGAPLAAAVYAGRRRNPVLLSREHWTAVAEAAHGDVGARRFLDRHPDLVRLVECGDVADPADIDTPEDLERVRKLWGE
jgi:CTP:molybdopterin cytidylyltransferase MocA